MVIAHLAATSSPAGSRRRGRALPAATWLILLLALLAVLLPTAAHAQEWRYRVRPGDTVWDLSRKYVRTDIHWERVRAHNNIDDPGRLTPGTQLSFPIAWLRRQPARARVVAVAGEASASRDGSFSDAVPVVAGMLLETGSALRTPGDASLTVEFADGSRLQLHGDGELHFDRLSTYGATGMVDTRLRLPRGTTSSSVKRSLGPASQFVIETPGMMSSVRGTVFRVGTDGVNSRSEVIQGRVQVSGSGGSVLLSPGRGTRKGADGRPLPPQALLPAPDLSAWPAHIERIPAILSWPAVQGARGYRLQLSSGEDFPTLLLDTVTEHPEARLDLRVEGPLHARIRAIDAQGLEGLDAVGAMTVAAQPAPPFLIAPTDGGTAAGARPRFRWTGAADEALRYRVQVAADPGFQAPLLSVEDVRRNELRAPDDLAPGGYYWRIGATDASGRQGPWSDPVGFALHPAGPGPELGADVVDGGLQVRWQAGEEGQRYRFQLSRRPDFATPEIDRELALNAIDLPGLRAGTWYLRVQAIDSDGYAYPFGPVQTVKAGCLPCRILAGAGGAAILLLVL